MLNFKFTHRSESHWAEVRSRFDQARVTIQAGVFGGESDDGTPLVDVAAFNELGTSSAPARPFISPAMRAHRAEATQLLAEAVKELLADGSVEKLHHLGDQMVAWIRGRMLSGPFTPLAKSTVQRKGHARPLVDTWALYDSISYRVVSS